MRKLVVFAALAFALGSIHQASACDWSAHAANATAVVVADCGTSGCATDEPPPVTTQQPVGTPLLVAPKIADCQSGCAIDEPVTTEQPIETPVPVAPKIADCGTAGCATDEPPPVSMQEPADCSGSPNCATPAPAPPKVACNGDACATDEPVTSAPVTTACNASDC